MNSDTPDDLPVENEAPGDELPEDDLAPPSEPEPAADTPDPARSVLGDEQEHEPENGAVGGGAFLGVPIEVTISVGKARPMVSELVKLRRDSVISLDSKVDDPVEIYIGDKLIARGELQEMEGSGGQLGVRLTEVADIASNA